MRTCSLAYRLKPVERDRQDINHRSRGSSPFGFIEDSRNMETSEVLCSAGGSSEILSPASLLLDPISVIINSITDPMTRPSVSSVEARVVGAKRRLSLNASVSDRLNANMFIHLKRHQGSTISALVHESFNDIGSEEGIVHLIHSRRLRKGRSLHTPEINLD